VKRYAALVVLTLLLTACELITVPEEGAIVPEGTVTVAGSIDPNLVMGGTLEVNGVAVPVNPDRSWSVDLPTTGTGTVMPIEAVYTQPDGFVGRERTAIVVGPSIADGERSPDGVGMRFTNTGLANLGPVINDLAAGAFDISALLLAQNPLIEEENAFLHFDITGNAYEAGLGSVGLAATSTAGGVRTTVTVQDLFVGADLVISDGLLIESECRLELQIPTTTIVADFDLRPTPGAERFVDVNMVGAPSVSTSSVGYEFISGICDGDVFLIGDIVNLVAGPQIQSLVAGGFASQLGDPDGAGPADSPIAAAIQSALAEISIAGTVGEAVHANLDAPFTQITETGTGIDFRADADFFSSVGNGPSDCQPPSGAPDLDGTFDVPAPHPSLGPTTPSGAPYGLGLTISASAFNQLLGAMTECGLLNRDLTQIPLGGVDVPVTSSTLALLVPQFAGLPPATPMRIRLKPYVAPFLTGDPGPSGEPSELMIADLHIQFIEQRPQGDLVWLQIAVDSPLGFELAFDGTNGVLAPTITPPPAAVVDARVLSNLIGADVPTVEAAFPALFPSFASSLGDTFTAFPLPAFLGLRLDVVEMTQADGYYVLYADLHPAPQTHIANVAVTDLSTPNQVIDSIFDASEWRHRIRTSSDSGGARIELDGVVVADACCSTGDETQTATAAYRLTFDVLPAEGDTWQVDLGHLLAGAHTLIDEQDGGGETAFTSAVTARARIGGGAWQTFAFNPSVMSVSTRDGAYQPFVGGNSLVLQGTTVETITVEVTFGVRAFSDSNVIFPIRAGDEAAIRFGANDTIVNGVTAGGYPGVGNRDITADGHVLTVAVSSAS
jgi:hypothetical protein